MGLFNTILTKLGIKKEEEEEAPPEKKGPAKVPSRMTSGEAAAARGRRMERIRAARASKEIPLVDVMAKLEKLAAEKPMQSNWKTSIADLLFMLDIDHSYENRKELAIELKCPEEFMDDSAEMNTWLHKTVLEMIAENGGNIPLDLLD